MKLKLVRAILYHTYESVSRNKARQERVPLVGAMLEPNQFA